MVAIREQSNFENGLSERTEAVAREGLNNLLEQLKSEDDSGRNGNNSKFILDLYRNLEKEILNENYELIIKYNRNSSDLYQRAYEEVHKKKYGSVAFDLGRIIGSSQMANRISETLYSEKESLNMLAYLSRGKNLKEILFYCDAHDKAYNQDLCELFKLQPNNLHKKMQYLVSFDLVDRHISGRRVYYTVTLNGRRVAAKLADNKDGFRTVTIYCDFSKKLPAYNQQNKILPCNNYKRYGILDYQKMIARTNYEQ